MFKTNLTVKEIKINKNDLSKGVLLLKFQQRLNQ